MTLRTALLTIAAMLAFAANSLLCRLALGHGLIDAATFADVRVISGAVALGLILVARGERKWPALHWQSVAALFVYVALFSFAYRWLSAGTGALILFGAVQLTMFVTALRRGEHFSLPSWAGLVAAVAGLIYLVSPGVTAPDPLGAVLMAVAASAGDAIRCSAGAPPIPWRPRPVIFFMRCRWS
jgi:drug/metabolite transporter (DMT)-like permease